MRVSLLLLAVLVLGIIATTTMLAPCAYGWFPPVPPPPPPPDPGPLPVPEPIPDPPPTCHEPEPSTLVLLSLGAGLLGMKALRRRKKED